MKEVLEIDIIKKIYKDKVVSKKTKFADKEDVLFVLEQLTKSYSYDEKPNADEEIDFYVDWKNTLLGILVSEIKTKSLSYILYSCTFLNESGNIDNLHFALYKNIFVELAAKNQR